MPYELTRSGCPEGKPFGVRNKETGKIMGCSDTEEEAKAHMRALVHMRALYANSDKSHVKTAIKREHGMDFPPRDYAYVPDPMRPATWRLRLTEVPGEVTELQLQRAAAALSPKGFQGNRLQLPGTALTSVKRRLLAEFRRLKVAEGKIPSSVKEVTEEDFMVWKDAKTGMTRWFAIYSNNFRDNDRPSEIISEQSHINFVDLVDGGIVDYPELWLWHVKGTAWGKADWVAYSHGFAMASGLVYPGFESLADNLAKRGNLRVSHGMPKELLVRDPHNKSVILFHVTAEISPLPDWAAANMLTGFYVLGEGEYDMTKGKGLPAEKKDFLAEVGLSEETVERLDSTLQKAQALAANAGLESKATTVVAEDEDVDLEIEQLDQGDLQVTQVRASVVEEEEPETEEEEVAEVIKAAPAAKAKATAKLEEEAERKKKMPATKKKEAATSATEPTLTADVRSDYPTRQEIADALIPMMETIEALTQTVENLTKEISDLKAEDAEKIALTKEVTPTLSLSDLISRNAIGKSRAVVKENSNLNKEGPVETEAPLVHQQTMVPLINEMISKSRTASRNGVMAQ